MPYWALAGTTAVPVANTAAATAPMVHLCSDIVGFPPSLQGVGRISARFPSCLLRLRRLPVPQ